MNKSQLPQAYNRWLVRTYCLVGFLAGMTWLFIPFTFTEDIPLWCMVLGSVWILSATISSPLLAEECKRELHDYEYLSAYVVAGMIAPIAFVWLLLERHTRRNQEKE